MLLGRPSAALDGALQGAPRFGEMPGFDKAELPLIEARVAEWQGWIFLNASGEAPSFEASVGNLDELLAPFRELPAMVMMDCIVRRLPGRLNNDSTLYDP